MQFYQVLEPTKITDDWLWKERLESLLDYLSEADRDKVREALVLAYTSHDGQKRKSGEPFITHPVEVTRILAELKMDWESLAAGLLHDAVEDQPNVISFEEIEVRARFKFPCSQFFPQLQGFIFPPPFFGLRIWWSEGWGRRLQVGKDCTYVT